MKTKFFALFLACLSLSGCDETVEIKDGKISAEFIPAAQNYFGTYSGQTNRGGISLSLGVDAENHIILSGSGPVAEYCQSSYGALKTLKYSKKDEKISITEASFAFDPGLCIDTVMGDSVTLSFENDRVVNFSLLDHADIDWQCGYTSGSNGVYEYCHRELQYKYITGQLTK